MKYLFALLFCLLVFLLGSFSPAAAERVYLDITAQDMRKVVVAVPWFTGASGAADQDRARAMAELLARGLEFHGFIEILDSQRYGGRSDADWKTLGADYVVLGRYEIQDSGLIVEGRLLDVGADRMLAGRRYRGDVSQQEDMVLRLCDHLVEEFTGEEGISRSRLAFVSDASGKKEVYVASVLGMNMRQVTRHKHLAVSPRFSPDGIYLAYSSYHSGNQNLYLTDLRQNQVTRAISRRKGMNLAPAWSPDGRSMIVTLSKDGSPDLYRIDREGKVLERLTQGAGINVSASWSPDGKSIVFVSDRSGRPQLYIMNVKSKQVRRLTFEGSENSEPAWSPKGDLIAFTGQRGGGYQIFVINPDDPLSARQVSSGWGEFESPTWSPDGKQIAFSRRRDGKQQICVMQKDGRDIRVLFDIPGNQTYPQWTVPMD
ncbi:MAG: Tol-Pal system beta propeller repeat protein TolB [Desulfobulbaceae bacterium]|nr:Tol-Pal system beta propeller repeat protein TolB [Desulfobulbaceae bacterium]